MSGSSIKVKDFFVRDIKRELNGVIVVDQKDEKNVYTELDEYIITAETNRNLTKFFEALKKSIDEPNKEVGVWVSGFFGSGKSHFIKMLSYLLENKEVKGKTAIDFFKEKIDDPALMADIEKVVKSGNKDVILFNIDTKSKKTGDKSELILNVLMKVFNEFRGYVADFLWVAEFEEDLESRNLYDKFKEEFKKINGTSWVERRSKYAFYQDDIIEALVNCGYQSRDACVRLFDSGEKEYSISVEKFAEILKNYTDSKGKDHQVIFLVDEVGQYIGDKSDFMLDLQSIVEEIGTVLMGKVWIVVTSQADIDKTIREQVKGYDFSKIQGRFITRLPLSSANVDEVIKKRLLLKKDEYKASLSSFYTEKKTILRNIISFTKSAEMKTFTDDDSFVSVYPFVPYQFKLLQKVFEQIRISGTSGRHLAKGERSMLSAFKEAAVKYSDESLGIIIPFSSFYDTVESFIDPIYKRTIDNAADNECLKKPEDINLLKILFMIRGVKEISPNIDNLTVLSISSVDEDTLKLRESLQESLDRLIEQTLIHKSQDNYIFLTDEEQAINREIKSIDIDRHQIRDEIHSIIFSDICPSAYKVYKFNKIVDDYQGYKTNNDLTVKFLTHLSDDYPLGPEQESLDGENIGLVSSEDTLLFVFPKEKSSVFVEQLRASKRIDKYIMQNRSTNNSSEIEDIFNKKSRERENLYNSSIQLISDAISVSKVFICDKAVPLDEKNPKQRINDGLEKLVENVYSKSDYVKEEYETENDVFKILKNDDLEKYGVKNETNKIAREEILEHLKIEQERNNKVYLNYIKEKFTRKPYGWKDMTISGLVALLYVTEEVSLRYQKENLLGLKPDVVAKYLTKRIDADKVEVLIRKKTAEDQMIKVKSILRDLFDKTDIPVRETALFSFSQNLLQEEIAGLEAIKSKYVEESRYPGKEQVDDYYDLLKKLIDLSDPSSFFNRLISEKDLLKDLHKKASPVLSFFNSEQVKIFRKILQKIALYKRDIQFLSDDAKDHIKRIDEIIELDEPYSSIKELPQLEHKIEESLQKSLKDQKNKVSEKLKNAVDEIKKEFAKHEKLSDDFKKSILDSFNSIEDMINDSNECTVIESQLSRIDMLREDAYKQIEKQIHVGKESDGKYEGKQTVYLNNTQLFKHEKTIETDEDLEEYIEELKSKLKELLKKKKIRVM